jgi:hypothetical protein
MTGFRLEEKQVLVKNKNISITETRKTIMRKIFFWL